MLHPKIIMNVIMFNSSLSDILDGDIKSILDVLWLIILNYGIHSVSKYYHTFNINLALIIIYQQHFIHKCPSVNIHMSLC